MITTLDKDDWKTDGQDSNPDHAPVGLEDLRSER